MYYNITMKILNLWKAVHLLKASLKPFHRHGAMRTDLKKKFIKNQPFAIIAYK